MYLHTTSSARYAYAVSVSSANHSLNGEGPEVAPRVGPDVNEAIEHKSGSKLRIKEMVQRSVRQSSRITAHLDVFFYLLQLIVGHFHEDVGSFDAEVVFWDCRLADHNAIGHCKVARGHLGSLCLNQSLEEVRSKEHLTRPSKTSHLNCFSSSARPTLRFKRNSARDERVVEKICMAGCRVSGRGRGMKAGWLDGWTGERDDFQPYNAQILTHKKFGVRAQDSISRLACLGLHPTAALANETLITTQDSDAKHLHHWPRLFIAFLVAAAACHHHFPPDTVDLSSVIGIIEDILQNPSPGDWPTHLGDKDQAVSALIRHAHNSLLSAFYEDSLLKLRTNKVTLSTLALADAQQALERAQLVLERVGVNTVQAMQNVTEDIKVDMTFGGLAEPSDFWTNTAVESFVLFFAYSQLTTPRWQALHQQAQMYDFLNQEAAMQLSNQWYDPGGINLMDYLIAEDVHLIATMNNLSVHWLFAATSLRGHPRVHLIAEGAFLGEPPSECRRYPFCPDHAVEVKDILYRCGHVALPGEIRLNILSEFVGHAEVLASAVENYESSSNEVAYTDIYPCASPTARLSYKNGGLGIYKNPTDPHWDPVLVEYMLDSNLFGHLMVGKGLKSCGQNWVAAHDAGNPVVPHLVLSVCDRSVHVVWAATAAARFTVTGSMPNDATDASMPGFREEFFHCMRMLLIFEKRVPGTMAAIAQLLALAFQGTFFTTASDAGCPVPSSL
ncbi:hypothetical protein OF83DRAFT_1088596 [Amylostereum chailletii]|nr:hypothetical protein OF83DRAFT_1088596 [Amylostereum chailletii]